MGVAPENLLFSFNIKDIQNLYPEELSGPGFSGNLFKKRFKSLKIIEEKDTKKIANRKRGNMEIIFYESGGSILSFGPINFEGFYLYILNPNGKNYSIHTEIHEGRRRTTYWQINEELDEFPIKNESVLPLLKDLFSLFVNIFKENGLHLKNLEEC